MRTLFFVLGLGLAITTTSSCNPFSRSAATAEVVLPPTEVGAPGGDKVSKGIGPSGGALTSQDGRITLTVPPSVLNETIEFSIQPITNRAQMGLGLAYRLEPDGKTFPKHLELSVRYDDRDLDGTAADALAIAYQDKERKWHMVEPARLDETAKVVTFLIDHFTDFSFLARMRIEPPTSTLRVGETMQLKLVGCGEPGTFQFPHPGACVMGTEVVMMDWFTDIGTVTTHLNPAIYTAPPVKPNPNVATVTVPYNLPDHRNDRGILTLPGEGVRFRRGMFTARITIVDRGYRATGSDGPLTFSGTVCRLDKPFTIYGQSQLRFEFLFTPSASGTDGSVAIGGGGMGVSINRGSGSYTVSGIETDSPRLVVAGSFTGSYPGVGSAKGSGTKSIQLVPLESNECAGQ